MYATVLERAAQAGWRGLALDLPGFGDSPYDGPSTWRRMVDALDGFWQEASGEPVVLCVHDWGGLLGLRWAAERPEAIRGLVLSDCGFFPDGKWHGMAKLLRTEGEGERLIASMDRAGFGGMMGAVAPGMSEADIEEYWKAYDGEDRRRGHLELYRSGTFSELVGEHEHAPARLGVPTLILWGSEDAFAPVAGAHRFAKAIPRAELRILDGVGHFIFDDAPEEAAGAVAAFLQSIR
jgi:haloalkane dehalogenase